MHLVNNVKQFLHLKWWIFNDTDDGENEILETHMVEVPHAPLQDVTFTRSFDLQPWLYRYIAVVDTLHGWPLGTPETLWGNNILIDLIYSEHVL